jgi:hypothetical protein
MGGYGGHGYYLDPIFGAVNHLKQSARARCYTVVRLACTCPRTPQHTRPLTAACGQPSDFHARGQLSRPPPPGPRAVATVANARPSREVLYQVLVDVVLLAPAVVLVVLVFLAGVSAETGFLGAVALAVVSVAWLLVNEPVEGLTLFVVAPEHGLTGSDLAGLTGLGLAVWRGHQALRPRRN